MNNLINQICEELKNLQALTVKTQEQEDKIKYLQFLLSHPDYI